MAQKTSGRFACTALLLAIWIAAGYLYFIHDWYWNHSAVICTPRLMLDARQGDYCYFSDPGQDHDEAYAGLGKFWGDDIISNFFANVADLVFRWANETIVPWFYEVLAPAWNAYAAEENHRKILAAIIGLLYAGGATKAVALVIEWLHDKVADGEAKPGS